MRPLEILLVLCGVAALARPLLPSDRRARLATALPGVAACVLLLHVALEGYRWQLAPVYVLILAFSLWAVARRGRSGDVIPRRAVPLLVGVGIVLLGSASALGVAIPVTGFPNPTGPHAVGTRTYHWVDAARGEPATDDPEDRRELMVQMWYPADPTAHGERAPYIANVDVVAPHIAHNLGLPQFVLNHASLLRSHALTDAPLAARERYPLLIFSHGNTGMRTQNTTQFEEMASRGYIVASVDHTYNALVTVFPDGRAAFYRRGGVQFWRTTPELERAHEDRVSFRARDLSFVLDQLERSDRGELDTSFAGRIDWERVGVFGHSYGGATAAQACWMDPRFKAGVNLDGWMYGGGVETGLRQPFMMMGATVYWTPSAERLARAGTDPEQYEAHRAYQNAKSERLFSQLSAGGWFLRIDGMAHYNFADIPLISPLMSAISLTGPIDGRRGLDIVSAYMLAFFDYHLRGIPSPLLDGPAADFPEVHMRIQAPQPATPA